MTAFRISRETRDRLELYGLVVGTATQPAFLRWDYMRGRSTPVRPDSPWEVRLYPDVEFPTINGKMLSVGFGPTPDIAVERALDNPDVRNQNRLSRALWLLEAAMRDLEWCIKLRINNPGFSVNPLDDDDIPF